MAVQTCYILITIALLKNSRTDVSKRTYCFSRRENVKGNIQIVYGRFPGFGFKAALTVMLLRFFAF